MSNFIIQKNEGVSIMIKLPVNPKLEQYFPNDPHSDITIIFGQKNYKLQKAYLRVDSLFFSDAFETDKSLNLLVIGKKYDVNLFEKILKCFYGSKTALYGNEIYFSYEICKYLKSDSLIEILNEEILNHFNEINFFTVYQLGFMFEINELLEKCYNFIKVSNFKKIVEENVYSNQK